MSSKCPSCGEVCSANQELCMMCYTPLTNLATHQDETAMVEKVDYLPTESRDGYVSHTNANIGITNGEISGIAKNINEENNYEPNFIRIFRSFTKGTPYSKSGSITTFQVFENWGDDFSGTNQCTDVVFYSKMVTGKVSENNRVSVTGKRNINGTLMADSIYNSTTHSVTKGSIGDSISSTIIRMSIIFAMIAITGVLYFITSNFSSILYVIKEIIITLLTIWVIVQIIKFVFRRDRYRRNRYRRRRR